MKVYQILILPVLLILPYSSFTQEYSYTHYDVKDGLAGSNVYCITQDKQGFLWMGTEGGVSRFDGTHFKNFTLEDGLPDIEILHIFADSRGRIWMSPFSKSICYYYEGRIHNQENDSLLQQMHIRSGVENFAEDKDGNILMQEHTILHLVTVGGYVREMDSINGRPMQSSAVSKGPDGHFLVQDQQEIYNFSGKSFRHFHSTDFEEFYTNFIALGPQLIVWKYSWWQYKIYSFRQGKTFSFGTDKEVSSHVSFSLAGDSLVYENGSSGTTEHNIFTGSIRHFSIGGKISRTFRDDEGNTWFTSLGQGIFRLNSENIKNIRLSAKNATRCVALTIRRADNELLIGATSSMVFRFALPSFKDAGSYEAEPSEVDEVHYVEKMKDGRLLIGTSVIFFPNHIKSKGQYPSFSVKSACLKNDSEVLAGGHSGVYLFDTRTFKVKDILFRERATVVYLHYGRIYIGTIDGLYVKEDGKPPVYWGLRDPLLKKRISSVVQSADSTLWVATYGGGIIGWKNGRRVAELTRRQGLSSDLCRVLELHDNMLWVGTDKGLNRIELNVPGYPVTAYTASDGLNSDMINAICVDSAMVYVGTPAGLSFFDASRAGSTSGCRLNLLNIITSGKEKLSDTAGFYLPYNRSNIRFEFAGISYRSAGDISFRYRLLGLDSSWKKTKESSLEYPTLPSGDYELQLQAVNKFGKPSKPLFVRFAVTTPFWRTAWFIAMSIALFLFLTWLFVTLRIKHLRRRQTEREELHKRLAETEHMALQAQMNPHFIFNCLNSIQQYIFDQDIFIANKYITGFAKLIRSTLNNSTKPFISLAEEIDYLSAYLSLEKLRFKDKMIYSVSIEPSLRNDIDEIFIPPMLIQPYVENSMRHGLRHRTGDGGYIHINVMQEGDKLTFVIEDNGIGREQAARYKTREHIEYQSKGMSLTADRIRLINTANGENIMVEVFDLKDKWGEPSGTRVIVRFPRFELFLQKNTI